MSKDRRYRRISRRRFFGTSAGAAMGTGAGLLLLPSRARAVSPNEKIVMGHIGVGGMGNAHVSWFASHADVEIAAICDVDKNRCQATLKRLRGMRPDTRAEPYYDFRRVLERDDIDAISCATPDHWHALITILAFQAGKDVYSEKPLSHNLAEGQAMLRAGRRYRRVFQLGTQIHAGDNYHRVVELVRSGVLGKIHTVRLWKTGGSGDMGYPPEEDPPPELDWNTWLGPAPWRPYVRQRCHHSFRSFWDYSGGVYADFWCHISDIFFWSIGPGQPKTIDARGQVPNGIADTPAWIDVDYEFPGVKVHWTTRVPDVAGAEGKGIGCQFEGAEGSLVCDYGSRAIFLGDKQMDDIPDVPKAIPRSPGHQRNFLDCIKSRTLTESNLAYVREMTIPMHVGCISFRLGRKLTWDAQTEQFVGDDAANRLLSRPYRPPWSLPT